MGNEQRELSQDDQRDQFVERLGRLRSGDRAILRRNAGHGLNESRNALGVFYRLLPPGVPPAHQEAYFLVATLYPLAKSGSHRNLGATLRAARTASNSPGIDRRMEVLLEADVEQLPFRLRQAVRFAQSNRVPVNWRQLLRDVLWWEHPDRFVQRQWAEAYFGQQVPQNQRP